MLLEFLIIDEAEQRRQKTDRRPQVSSFPYEWANIIFPTVEKETEYNNVLSLRSVEMTDVSAGNLETTHARQHQFISLTSLFKNVLLTLSC